MKLLKVNKSSASAFKAIKDSMTKTTIVAHGNLDACGCTGNGNC